MFYHRVLETSPTQTTETFKRHLDKWLSSISDTPKIDGYGANVAAETNSIFHQTRYCIIR